MEGIFKYLAAISLICGMLFIKVSDGMKCYQCNSLTDPYCDTLGNETDALTYLKPCENVHNNSAFCRKIVQHVKFSQSMRIIRRCGWETDVHNLTCKSFEDDDHKEIVCQCFEDGCNAANQFSSPSSLLMRLPPASLFYYMLLQ
ncbi:hypothetical protein LSTR_LSTR001602 [Laodelphax striatellus]|uniref:Uncharacterized protein n=1 Tax=Laodelphax striatellus TaxID=195883 RepID=A0A482XDE9_LAOST|nr:hypothetical protein LSTR_LSTR001602 [Laodelphax striatellus]